MGSLIEDWNSLINEDITSSVFVKNHWEDFLGVYIKTMRTRDDSDLYLKLYDSVEKMIKLDVVPVFEYPAQLIQYFRNCLVNNKINDIRVKKIEYLSLDSLNDEFGFEAMGDADVQSNDYELNQLLCEIEKRVSPLQMTSIMLVLKGYTRREISESLGINLHTINDRIYRTKEIIQDILKNQY